jgi:hypothetical protein
MELEQFVWLGNIMRGFGVIATRAGRDSSALGDVERAQYNFRLLSFLRRAESLYFQSESRTLRDTPGSTTSPTSLRLVRRR